MLSGGTARIFCAGCGEKWRPATWIPGFNAKIKSDKEIIAAGGPEKALIAKAQRAARVGRRPREESK